VNFAFNMDSSGLNGCLNPSTASDGNYVLWQIDATFNEAFYQ
jgi:hypothetical protein